MTYTIEEDNYEIISSNKKCIGCIFQLKIALEPQKQINISCRHPRGPGNISHCIYFKSIN